MKGLKELIERIRKESDLNEDAIEQELNKILPETHVPKNVFNEKSTALKNAETQLTELNKQLEEVKKSAGASEDLKKQITDLQAQQAAAKTAYEKELTATKRGYAIDQALTSAKAKNIKAVKALLDDSKLTLGDDGTLIGIKEQLEAVQKDNAYLFDIETPPTNQPLKPSFGGGGGAGGGTGGDLLSRMESAAGIRATTQPAQK